jgi:hypothetical protein
MFTNDLLEKSWAVGIIKRMEIAFGDKFIKQWGANIAKYGMDDFIVTVQEALAGLSEAEISRGLATMRTKIFVPSLSEFRSWCRPISEIDSAWLSPDQAWAVAVESTDENKTVIWTEQTAQAFGFVQALLEIGDKFSAARAFKERYAALVERAKAKWEQPKVCTSLGHDQEHRIAVVQQAQHLGLIAHAPQEVVHLVESKQPLSSGAKEQLALMRARLGVEPVKTDPTKQIQERKAELIEQLKIRHIDPFDDRDEYIELCNKNIDLPYQSANLRNVHA